jgi:hypothetical protein
MERTMTGGQQEHLRSLTQTTLSWSVTGSVSSMVNTILHQMACAYTVLSHLEMVLSITGSILRLKSLIAKWLFSARTLGLLDTAISI